MADDSSEPLAAAGASVASVEAGPPVCAGSAVAAGTSAETGVGGAPVSGAVGVGAFFFGADNGGPSRLL